MSDLFQHAFEEKNRAHQPLAARMRPQSLEELVGHERILAKNMPLREWIENDSLPSIILWGPPGSGKTTLALVIANQTKSRFETLSAVTSGTKEIKELVARAKAYPGQRTICFIDEIHRYSRTQQDTLLPFVEDGTLTLIGATTENPSFELNAALLSRARVIRLEPLKPTNLSTLIRRAIESPDRGLNRSFQLSDEAIEKIAVFSDGDARRALGTVDILASLLKPRAEPYSAKEVFELLGSTETKTLRYDSKGEEHYNVISAFIKSMRASDPDAAVYYLARMIAGGEDPLFIARRMVIFASEDVGLADSSMLSLAIAARQAVETLGMPEGRIPLAHVAIQLALAKKSRAAYDAIGTALAETEASGSLEVPMHLRNAVTSLMREQGYGARAPKATPGESVNLPAAISKRQFVAKSPANPSKEN